MRKETLDGLLKRGVLTHEEHAQFFKSMHENGYGQLVGCMPGGVAQRKYDYDGNLLDGSLLEFVLSEVVPPLGVESYNKTFKTYGYTYGGISEGWMWYRQHNITDELRRYGYKPIEEATEAELWEMIAIASRYWFVFYKRLRRGE